MFATHLHEKKYGKYRVYSIFMQRSKCEQEVHIWDGFTPTVIMKWS